VSFVSRTLTAIQRPVAFLVGAAVLCWGIWYVVSIFWPIYDVATVVDSPSHKYALVVLRGDAAAFDDFSYHIFLFPRDVAPRDLLPHARIYMLGKWRGAHYLVYSGYSYPELRWTAANAIEIDTDNHYPEVGRFYPVKQFGADEPIRVSLVFGGKSPLNHDP
jgi:hypothetical protein